VRIVLEVLLKHDDILPFETLRYVPDSLGSLPKEILILKKVKAFQKFTDFNFLKQLCKTPVAFRKTEAEQQKARERLKQLIERINGRASSEVSLWFVKQLENINENISELSNKIDQSSEFAEDFSKSIKAFDPFVINWFSQDKGGKLSSYLFELICYGVYSTRRKDLEPLDFNFIVSLIADADLNNTFDNTNKINQWDLTQAGRYNLNKFEQSQRYLQDVQKYQEYVDGSLNQAIKYLEELMLAN